MYRTFESMYAVPHGDLSARAPLCAAPPAPCTRTFVEGLGGLSFVTALSFAQVAEQRVALAA
jgi:hypothetical protein